MISLVFPFSFALPLETSDSSTSVLLMEESSGNEQVMVEMGSSGSESVVASGGEHHLGAPVLECQEALGEVDPPLRGGDSSLGRAGPLPDGGKLASTLSRADDWGALTSSYDSGELCGAYIEASGVEAGSVRVGAPTWAKDFTGDCAGDLLVVRDEDGIEAGLNCHFLRASPL
ncbi:hypothetical protein Nepgr_027945 [Nepenthes gracilis]|uniref:Uncharacterized protein n=1 Tax=Nepenthes gracilis TaxID=150966 RepID=A0AAD3TCN8_NEPGR|nr:hypothetical protein Nepgr_027945 [Nepenthes gracilis]